MGDNAVLIIPLTVLLGTWVVAATIGLIGAIKATRGYALLIFPAGGLLWCVGKFTLMALAALGVGR